MYDATLAETVLLTGHGGDQINGYLARPLDGAPRGGVVVIHHMPGYDRETKEFVRRFAVDGYNALCPNLYARVGLDVSPDDAAAEVRAQGGVPDEQVMGDLAAAAGYLRALTNSNGKVASIGHCSGGRHGFLAAATVPLDASIICYSGAVVGDPPPQMKAWRPLLDRAPEIRCPILGLYGNDDQFPTPQQVDQIEQALKDAGKDYEFHRYDGAGHAFFSVDRDAYRPQAALDGWQRIGDFLARHIGKS